MSKRSLVISLLAAASFFVACGDVQQEQSAAAKQAAAVQAPENSPIVEVKPFTAPAQPVVTLEQAKRYVKASAGLVELGVVWTTKIDQAPDAEKVQMLEAYNVARDQLCARVGLTGGIAEYNWITAVALPNKDNKATFEAAGLKK
ncbi:MAG: hypothetical protein MJY47_07555 [Fibrobacter sp.]|nr:hypothetical protein [Fibrobacter sp.]